MDIRVTSQGGQPNLNTSFADQISQVQVNREVGDTVSNKDTAYSKDDIAKAVDKLNSLLKEENTYAEYSIHDELGDVMIKIVDKNTKEVIVEYPPKKILDMIAKLCELAGIAIDKKA